MRVLLTGVSGYVGAALVPRLRGEGHRLRGYGRSAARVRAAVDDFVEGDAVLGTGLAEALDGVEVAYYLIHSMETLAAGAFAERERAPMTIDARMASASGAAASSNCSTASRDARWRDSSPSWGTRPPR